MPLDRAKIASIVTEFGVRRGYPMAEIEPNPRELADLGECRGCGQKIRWIGKNPCDPATIEVMDGKRHRSTCAGARHAAQQMPPSSSTPTICLASGVSSKESGSSDLTRRNAPSPALPAERFSRRRP